MSDKTKIEWTDTTWNPIRGCSRVSEGCRNCYAEGVAARWSGTDKNGKPLPYDGLAESVAKPDGTTEARWTGKVVYAGDDVLMQPLKWKKPRRIFVNSMSDFFHENTPFETIDRIMAIIALCPQHIFQILTKRPERMYEYIDTRTDNRDDSINRAILKINGSKPSFVELPLKNLHLGVSVENQATANERIPYLLNTPAAIRFVSAEPLLGAVDFTRIEPPDFLNPHDPLCVNALEGTEYNEMMIDGELDIAFCAPDSIPYDSEGVDWIIVGGESGKNARPMHLDWARSMRTSQCAIFL
jgi:protein gp37